MYKSTFPLLVLLSFLLLSSCEKKEENKPPSEVSEITATNISGTQVLIAWSKAVDDDKNPIKYDLLVNNKVIKTGFTGTSVELDVTEFLSGVTSKSGIINYSSKNNGSELVLAIEIKATDSSNQTSTARATITIQINRPPGEFEFLNVYFDTEEYRSIRINWSPASDIDGDELLYTISINDIIIEENHKIPSSNDFGEVTYLNDFYELSSDPMTIKIIVSDGSVSNEITATYDFNATDINFGAIETPYNNEGLDYSISTEEPDGKIAFNFSISNVTPFRISNNQGQRIALFDVNNQEIVSEIGEILGELTEGSYSVVVFNNSSKNSNGVLHMVFEDPNEAAINLGELTVPSINEIEIDLRLINENTVTILTFEISEGADYKFEYGNGFDKDNFYLLNENDEEIPFYIKHYRFSTGNFLPPGKYKIGLRDIVNAKKLFTMKLHFGNFHGSDKHLGLIPVPDFSEAVYEKEGEDVDAFVRFYFEVEKPTAFYFSIGVNSSAIERSKNLWNADTREIVPIYGLNQTTFADNLLQPGIEYYIEYINTWTEMNDPSMTFGLKHPTASDLDLGILSIPTTIDDLPKQLREDSYGEADHIIEYTFEITEEAFFGALPSYSAIKVFALLDSNNEPIELAITSTPDLPPGVLYGANLSPGKYTLRCLEVDGINRFHPDYVVRFSNFYIVEKRNL